MSDGADRSNGDAGGDGRRGAEESVAEIEGQVAAMLDGEELGSLMMQQLANLIESWTDVLEAVAQHGIDPTPLLETLASTLRDTADQLDPPA